MKHRILITILLPSVVVAVVFAIWAASNLVPPILGYIEKSTNTSLELMTGVALGKCKHNFHDLLDRQIEEDNSMSESLKRDTLLEIKNLSSQFAKINLVVLDANGFVVDSNPVSGRIPAMAINGLDISGAIVKQTIFNKPARVAAFYFPSWRWYLVGYIYEKDYTAPLKIARREIFVGIFSILIAIMATAGLAFHFRVNQPLKRIIHAAGKVARGEFQKVVVVGKDEVSQVTAAFNSMVASLETGHHRIAEILSALRESEELYRVVIENILSQILLVHKGEIIFANQRALTESGYIMPEILGRPAIEFIHPDDRRSVMHMIRQRLTGKMLAEPTECRYITKDDMPRWIELTVVPISYQSENVLLIHGIDITQRKASFDEQQRLETKLRQAQKMEAIGTLAGGIAHDFNNLLMGIQGNISLVHLNMPENDPNYERLHSVQKYVKNGAELTRQLLGYARGGKYEVRPMLVNDLINQSAQMFGRTKKEVLIHTELQHDLWVVEADGGQIEQVLLNLYVNAWQAMPGGGDLYLKTSNIRLTKNEKARLQLSGSHYVCIEVTDTGSGMDEETQQKIFDPFFTTKQRERGTGLGLASAYGIVRNHNGNIICRSEMGRGTSFFIYLPKSEKVPHEDVASEQGTQHGSETVLLVDDEKMVTIVGEEMLEHLGYQVIVAISGQEAIDIAKDRGQEIDLVILDMIMPGMSGAETFESLRRLYPDMPILLCSGYSLDGQASEIMARGCDGFIQKPFDLDILSVRIREIFENHPQQRN